MSSHALPAKAEQLFRYLFEQSSLGIAVEDLDGKILLANRALCSMLGYQDGELAGMGCKEFANPEDSQDDWALFQKLRAGVIDHYTLEKRYVTKQGVPLWGRLNVSLLKTEDEEPPLVFAFVENITDHKLAEEALRQKEKELTETQRQAGIGTWSWDARSDRVSWSNEISLQAGYDPSLPAPNFKEQASLFSTESWDRLQWTMQEALRTGTSYELELEIASPKSKARWATTRGQALHDRDGQIIGLRGTIQDITQHKLAQQELARMNDRFRLAMEASKSVGWEYDIQTGRNSWFGDLQTMFGIPSDSFDGSLEDFYRRVHPEDRRMVAQSVADARQNRKPYAAEYRVVRLDGTVRWVAARGIFYYAPAGDALRMTGMAVDITDRRLAEESLRESEQRLRLAIQAGRMYAFDWDVITDVIVRSKESVDILSWQHPEHDTGREFHARIHPDDLALFTATEAKLTPDNPSYQVNFRAFSRNGDVIWLEDTGRASFDAQGKMVRVSGMVSDITRRKQGEEALRRSEELLRLAAEAGKMYAYDWDPATDTVTRSAHYGNILGLIDPVEHITRRQLADRVHPEDRARFVNSVDHLSPENPTIQISYRVLRPDGSVIWLEKSGRAFFDAHGKLLRVLGMVADVTDRKQAEERLREYEKVVEDSEEMIAVVDREYRYLIANRKFLNLRSLTKEQVVGRLVPEVLNQQVFEGVVKQKLDECFAGKVVKFELRYTYPELGERYLFVSYFPIEGATRVDRAVCILQDITERKQVEEALKKSEEKFSKAFQQSPMALTLTSVKDHRYIDVNETFERITGWRRDEVIGRTPFDIGIWADSTQRLEFVKRVLAEGAIRGWEVHYRSKDGTQRVGLGAGELIHIGNELCILSVIADITERKQAEEALKKSEEKFSKAFQQGPMALTLTSAKDHRFIDVNETFERITGWRRDQVIGRTSLDVGLWVNPAERLELAEQLLTGRSLRNLEFRFRMKDGSIRTGLSSAELIELDGEPCILGVTADITDYKRSQDALRESEARERSKVKELEAILDAVPVPVLIAHDAECRHITGNRAASEQLREAKGQNLSQSAPAGQRPAFRQIKNGAEIPSDLLPMQQAAATGKAIYGCDLTLVFEDGTQRVEIANAVPLLDENGRPRGAVGASMDVTELKRTEGALRESEDKLRLLLDSTAEAIYGIDLEHRCTFCNLACLRTLGYEHVDDLVGKDMHELLHHTHADGAVYTREECRVHRAIRTGEGVHVEDEVLWRANGTSFPAEYWSYPQRRGQEVIGAVVAFIDITERKLAEAALANVSRKLIEAQEQERTRIGRELHDDIGQRLALLAVELQRLQKDPLVSSRVRGRLGGLYKRTSEIAADTQSLSHELHSARLQYLGITVAMRGFCREFAEQQKVEVDFKANDLPSALSADISLCLFRVLQEALHNSAKHSGAKSFEVRLWGTEDAIQLTVKDPGKGFDRNAAETNQGLGLISMEERLKLVKGTLSIESQPGRGTTIDARVPVSWGINSMRAVG